MLRRVHGVAALVLALTFGLLAIGVEAQAAPPAAEAPKPAVNQAPENYLVGAGDSLQIFVWDHPDLTQTVQVRPDGKISTPLVEDLQAAGKSPTALARDVEAVLSEYVRSPVVTVIVTGFSASGSQQQIRVVGQAVTPKALPYRQGMTVLDVVIEVGGLSEFAAGNRARVVRNVNGKRTEIRVKLDDLLNGRTDKDIPMLPGDVLVIPESVL